MTALLLYPLCWRPVPTFPHRLSTVYFSFPCYFAFLCQIWEVSWRARGLRPCPRARARSSRRRRSTASRDLRSLGSEMAVRSPPAAACECSLGPARPAEGPPSRDAALLRGVFQIREFDTAGRFPSICFRAHHVRVKRRFMSTFFCAKAVFISEALPSHKAGYYIAPIDFAGRVIEG